jgi:hypothetical protein
MTTRAHATKTPTTNDKVLNLRIPGDLDDKAAEVAAKVKLKKSDTMRLAMDRGLDVLLEQLSAAPAA